MWKLGCDSKAFLEILFHNTTQRLVLPLKSVQEPGVCSGNPAFRQPVLATIVFLGQFPWQPLPERYPNA